MAFESPRKRLREEVTCPICLESFAEPVTLACEHNFCRSCILQSLAKSPTGSLCPLCKRAFHQDDLRPNNRMAGFSQLNRLLSDREEVVGREICGRHREPLKLFCKDREVLLCPSCEKEHQDHNIVPVEEAAQEGKDRISASLETLRKQHQEMVMTLSAAYDECEDFLDQMAEERQKATVRFQNMWPFLKKREVRTLTRMRRAEKQMERKKGLHMDQLNQKLSSLEDLIQEMEKKRELPASQLLQDVGSLMKRSKQKAKLKTPSRFLPALNQKLLAFTDSRVILNRAMKEFQGSVSSCY